MASSESGVSARRCVGKGGSAQALVGRKEYFSDI